MSADNEHDAPDEQQEDPAEIKPFRSCPAAILRRTDLRPADKLLYLYLCDRWRLNGKRPFQARQDTTMMETGLGRDPYYASVQRLTDLGLVESVRTGRSKMFRLFPISSDIRETRISDMRETRNSDGRYSRSSIVQHSSSTPSRERKDVPEKPAVSRRALQKQKKGKTTTAAEKKTVARSQKVCTPGSPLIPGGYNGIDATVDHDPALVAALESFDFAYTVPGPKNATPAGCLRAGGEALAVEHAKAAGWLAVGQDVLQYDAEGNVVGRDFAGWLNANKAEFPFAFEAGSIAADDRESFSRHLDAIASGLVTVAPRG